MKPKVASDETALLVGVAAASILIVIVSVGVFLFSAATSVGTEQDEIEGMQAAGVSLLLASSIILGWIVYGLKGAWRIVSAVPFAFLICLGLLFISPV